MSYAERAANACIGAERADLVLAGCAILEAIRGAFPAERIRIADRGLREGILSQMMRADRVGPHARGRAPRMAGGGSGREGGRALKTRVKTARKRTLSSTLWLERQLNDPFVAHAKREGYRSRAAYKLIEIDEKYQLFKPGGRIVDLGAAPGGWSQVAARAVKSREGKGRVIGIDSAGDRADRRRRVPGDGFSRPGRAGRACANGSAAPPTA